MPSAEAASKTIDYTSFLSNEAKGRVRSQLIELKPYMGIPGMISFGGGLPHPSTWPVNGMTLSVPFSGKSVFIPGYEGRDPSKLLPLAPYIAPPTDKGPDLTTDLQYTLSYGPTHLISWLTEHVKRIHNPPYPKDAWQVSNTAGNTDGTDGVLRTFLNRGDAILLEEFAFPGTLTHAQSLGLKAVGVPLDADGIVPAELDRLLEEWDEKERGAARPKVILAVPTCSNPTGVTYTAKRKKEVYAVASKWNLLIVEDDPYFFLQIRPKGYDTPLVPSFLSIDVDGRVLRIDSFSKFIAPGSRCGWVTGPKPLVTALLNKRETSSYAPSGFAVASIAGIIEAWGGHEGMEKVYLPHISEVYSRRATYMASQIQLHVPSIAAEVPRPSGGMFLWLRIRVDTHPLYQSLTPEQISDRVFHALIDEKVLVAPSTYFKVPGGPMWDKDEEAKRIFMRLSFSYPSMDDIEEGVKRLAKGLKKEWRIEG